MAGAQDTAEQVRHGPSGEPTCCAKVGPRGSASWPGHDAHPHVCSWFSHLSSFWHLDTPVGGLPLLLRVSQRGVRPLGVSVFCDSVLRHSEVWFVQSRAAGRAWLGSLS